MVALGNGLENHALKHLEPHWAPRGSSRSHVQFLYLYLLQNRTECTFQPETVLLPFVFSLQHYTQQFWPHAPFLIQAFLVTKRFLGLGPSFLYGEYPFSNYLCQR